MTSSEYDHDPLFENKEFQMFGNAACYGSPLMFVTDRYRYVITDPIRLLQNVELKYKISVYLVDALLGNFDRHNGNWGFLYSSQTDTAEIAPIFDCGNCLLPQADEKVMRNVLTNEDALTEYNSSQGFSQSF